MCVTTTAPTTKRPSSHANAVSEGQIEARFDDRQPVGRCDAPLNGSNARPRQRRSGLIATGPAARRQCWSLPAGPHLVVRTNLRCRRRRRWCRFLLRHISSRIVTTAPFSPSISPSMSGAETLITKPSQGHRRLDLVPSFCRAQIFAKDLAGSRFRHGGDELDPADLLVRGDALGDEGHHGIRVE